MQCFAFPVYKIWIFLTREEKWYWKLITNGCTPLACVVSSVRIQKVIFLAFGYFSVLLITFLLDIICLYYSRVFLVTSELTFSVKSYKKWKEQYDDILLLHFYCLFLTIKMVFINNIINSKSKEDLFFRSRTVMIRCFLTIRHRQPIKFARNKK